MALGKSLTSLNKSFLEESERYKKILIEDIPVMIGIHGEIVCIPKSDEVFACAIVGMSGTGKTVLLNSLISRLFYQWGSNISILNDVSEETYKWTFPMKIPERYHVTASTDFKKICYFNRLYLNQNPIGTPLTFLFPSTNTLSIPPSLGKNQHKSYTKISLPFSEIFDNLNLFLKAVSPDFSLGKSEMYVKEIPELANCSSVSEVKDLLDEKLPGANGKSFQAMRIKIMTAFGSLMREQILNITNPESPAYLQYGNYFGNPFTALMKAKVIPSLITSDLITKNYKSEYLAYFINKIFENNLKDFPGEKTFMCFDELKDVCRRDDESASKALSLVSARGRINNVGLIYCTQFYNQIPPSIRGAKLNYCFSFQHKNSEIIREIGSDFDLSTVEKKKILNLNKFEVLAMTNDKFVCYKDGDRYEVRQPIKGTIIGPLADHKKASSR